jgi:hypothetical protein
VRSEQATCFPNSPAGDIDDGCAGGGAAGFRVRPPERFPNVIPRLTRSTVLMELISTRSADRGGDGLVGRVGEVCGVTGEGEDCPEDGEDGVVLRESGREPLMGAPRLVRSAELISTRSILERRRRGGDSSVVMSVTVASTAAASSAF